MNASNDEIHASGRLTSRPHSPVAEALRPGLYHLGRGAGDSFAQGADTET